MSELDPTTRRVLRLGTRFGVVTSAMGLTIASWLVVSGLVAGAAGVDAGPAQVVMPAGTPAAGQPQTAGGSATSFSLKLPPGAACAADGNNGGRWHTYMVPASEDPAALAFAGNGALVGASTGNGGAGTFRNSIYSTSGVAVRGQAPNVGDAVIINVPNMNFSVWSAGNIPTGVYDIGIACVDLDLNSAMDSYWNTQLTFEADATDPIGVRWTATPTATTTTTSNTTSTSTPTTTSTTTTIAPALTTTTSAPATTTTTSAVAATASEGPATPSAMSDPVATGGAPSSQPSGTGVGVLGAGAVAPAGASGELPATGSHVALLLVCGLFLVVFGRMTVLLGRVTPVRGAGRP